MQDLRNKVAVITGGASGIGFAFAQRFASAGMKLVLGLRPFPSVSLVKDHPDWRIDQDGSGAAAKKPAKEEDLGSRLGCNLGPWGDYFIDVCAELVQDFGVDGYSFDGNYHPRICYCPVCRAACAVPAKANLDDVAYRQYLVWRGERLDGALTTANRQGAEKTRCFAALRLRYPQVLTIAYANAASDFEHLKLADEAWFINGSPELRREAEQAHFRCVTWQ